MKNKYLALIMAVIMCFSFSLTSMAAVEGTQITGQETVQPSEDDTVDKVVDFVNGAAGEEIGEAGEVIMDGIYEGQGILQTFKNILQTIKIALSNLVNTLFKNLNIGTGDSLFG